MKLCRRRCLAIEESDRAILPIIRRLKADHQFWGYRRIWAYLNFVERIVINKKRVYRLLPRERFARPETTRNSKRNGRAGNQSRARKNQTVGGASIRAKVLTADGWAYLVVVNDWFTKKILGAFVADRAPCCRLARSR